jgi:hypothetical protein
MKTSQLSEFQECHYLIFVEPYINWRHVVVGPFLATRWHFPQDSSPCELQILASEELLSWDKEHLLFKANVANETFNVKTHKRKEALAGIRHCRGGAMQWGLLV